LFASKGVLLQRPVMSFLMIVAGAHSQSLHVLLVAVLKSYIDEPSDDDNIG